MLSRIVGALIVLNLLIVPTQAEDLQVEGNLGVAGNADVQGSTFTLGSWDGVQTPGMGFLYDEDKNTGVLLWRASRFSAEWRFQHETNGGPTFDAVAIDSAHRLIVYGTGSGNAAKIILDPQSTSMFGTSVNFSGGDNQMPNQVLVGSASVLTRGLGDVRYLRGDALLSGDQSHVFGLERTTGTAGNSLTIQAGGAAVGSTSRRGGNLVLSSGISTGASSSTIEFKTSGNTVQSSADNPLTTRMKISGLGAVGIGSGAFTGTYFDPFGGLDISWGGIPSTLVLGAENNLTSRRSGYEKVMRVSMPSYLSTDPVRHVLEGKTYANGSSITMGRGFTDLWISTSTSGTADSPVQRIYLDRAGVITFNPNSVQNTLFRVRGNTDGNLLVVRGTTDRVGIGTSTPAAKLHVNGDGRIDGNLSVAGATTVTGTTTIIGATTVNGALTVTGPIRIEPQGDISMGEFAHEP